MQFLGELEESGSFHPFGASVGVGIKLALGWLGSLD